MQVHIEHVVGVAISAIIIIICLVSFLFPDKQTALEIKVLALEAQLNTIQLVLMREPTTYARHRHIEPNFKLKEKP